MKTLNHPNIGELHAENFYFYSRDSRDIQYSREFICSECFMAGLCVDVSSNVCYSSVV